MFEIGRYQLLSAASRPGFLVTGLTAVTEQYSSVVYMSHPLAQAVTDFWAQESLGPQRRQLATAPDSCLLQLSIVSFSNVSRYDGYVLEGPLKELTPLPHIL